MLGNRTWSIPTMPARQAKGLSHLDSEFCWCDPMVQVDEHGEETLVHKEVTWN